MYTLNRYNPIIHERKRKKSIFKQNKANNEHKKRHF